jgi:hypothetical protein
MRTNDVLRTAKPCGPGAPRLALSPQRRFGVLRGDGDNNVRSPGRARSKPSNHCAGKAGYLRLSLWFLPRAFSTHGGHGYQSIPGLPCALSLWRGTIKTLPRTRCVAGMRERVSPSLRAKRSNPECVRGEILDCFVADAPRNDGMRGCLTIESEIKAPRGKATVEERVASSLMSSVAAPRVAAGEAWCPGAESNPRLSN